MPQTVSKKKAQSVLKSDGGKFDSSVPAKLGRSFQESMLPNNFLMPAVSIPKLPTENGTSSKFGSIPSLATQTPAKPAFMNGAVGISSNDKGVICLYYPRKISS